MLRESLPSAIAADGSFEVVAAFESAEEALDANLWGEVDLALTDLGLPGISGIRLIEELRSSHPQLPVAGWSVHSRRGSVIRAIRAGARGYLLKTASLDEIGCALREIHAGGVVVSPQLLPVLFETIQNEDSGLLTRTECTIVSLLADGMQRKEIATSLGISLHTVHAHMKNVHQKLEAHNRSDVVRLARVLGYI